MMRKGLSCYSKEMREAPTKVSFHFEMALLPSLCGDGSEMQ